MNKPQLNEGEIYGDAAGNEKLRQAALRKLAEEATPGPWISDWDGTETLEDGEYADVSVWAGKAFDGKFINNVSFDNTIADGVYIAAANPSTILQLLDYIETLENALLNNKDIFESLVGENSTERLVCREAVLEINAALQGETE